MNNNNNNNNLAYDYHNLYGKARLYVQRALDEDREGELFPFWLSLSLELLGRATLSKISPTLLAEIKGDDSSNILYALGYSTTTNPKSIPTSVVFRRLNLVLSELKNEEKTYEKIINHRNMELHSGQKGFEEFPVKIWLGDFYKICKILLDQNGLELSDYLGAEEAKAAEKMIKFNLETATKRVLDQIKAFKLVLSDRTADENSEKLKLASSEVEKAKRGSSKIVKCPCCEKEAVVSAQLISVSEPKLIDNHIEQEKRYLPASFNCFYCNLKLNNYEDLKAVDIAAQYVVREEIDPLEFYETDVEQHVKEAVRNYSKQLDHNYYAYEDE